MRLKTQHRGGAIEWYACANSATVSLLSLFIAVMTYTVFRKPLNREGPGSMQKKISKLPFRGTPEQEEQLKAVIAENCHDESNVMNVMQKAQDIYGYLPIEVQEMIAEGMGVPLEKVFGVATFYAQFALSPKGDHNISVCLGTACYVKGSGDILDKFKEKLGIDVGECTPDGKFSLEACRCLGACGLAPVLTVNGEVYGRLVADDVDKILAKYSE